MMMMTQPDDNVFQDVLSDYAAPVADDGFTQSIMRGIDAESQRTQNLRRGLIYGACFVGGMIAATQLPGLMTLIGGLDVALPPVPASSPLPISQWTFVGVTLLGFVLWAALDRKTSEIF